MVNPRDILRQSFEAAIAAVQPGPAVIENLPDPPHGKTVVVGAGKGAIPMALALERAWEGSPEGLVIVPYGSKGAEIPDCIRVTEAAHPVPDAAGMTATQEILEMVSNLTADDLVICLISGGGSALLTSPQGVTLEEKASLMDQFLKCGATIHEINTVRKHLSAIKGGRLAAEAHPAKIVSLIVSDVVGDDLSIIASGPTVPDPSTYAQAMNILERYSIDHPVAQKALERGIRGELAETPKAGSQVFNRVENRLIITGNDALEAAKARLVEENFGAHITSDRIEGEAREVGEQHARQARELEPGQAIISGGETTVTVRGSGRGGPNLEFLLSMAITLDGEEGIHAMAADTDGIDGTSDAAGAFITPDTLDKARMAGLDPQRALANNDAHTFFASNEDLHITGPTGTNVNDIRIIARF